MKENNFSKQLILRLKLFEMIENISYLDTENILQLDPPHVSSHHTDTLVLLLQVHGNEPGPQLPAQPQRNI